MDRFLTCRLLTFNPARRANEQLSKKEKKKSTKAQMCDMLTCRMSECGGTDSEADLRSRGHFTQPKLTTHLHEMKDHDVIGRYKTESTHSTVKIQI